MEIVKPSFNFESDIDGDKILQKIEFFARNCYKNEGKITPDSAKNFVKARLSQKPPHEGILEHIIVSIRIICDRGISHELVRHRIGSYLQESTRYCNYQKKGLQFIEPFFFVDDPIRYMMWVKAMNNAEKSYNDLVDAGSSPQEARSVLPNSLKTDVIVTYNLRQWKHFFRLRCPKGVHPQMREITIPLLEEFKKKIPIVFDDLEFQF